MFTTPSAGKSVDSLSALSAGGRSDFPPHSRTGRPRSRHGSTASSIRSVGGALDHPSGNLAESLSESGLNAISTLLQPPIVRTGLQPHSSAPSSSTHKPPTAKDIPPVTLTNITHVETEEFAPYLTQFSALYEQLRRVKESEADSSPARKGSRQEDQFDAGGADGYLRPGSRPPPMTRKGSSASLSSINSIEPPSPLRRSSSFTKKHNQGPAPLSTIPNVYFEDDFHLENPRTFDVVSEKSEVIQSNRRDSDSKGDGNGVAAAPRKALATNAILQEKLSWYMDTIEVHLINSISTASTTFFTALGSLKELHSEAAESVQRIQTLRNELESLDQEIVAQGLEILHKQRRQENLRQLNDAVLQLRQIVDGVAKCEALVDSGEVEKALENIDTLESLVAGEVEQAGTNETPQIQYRDLRGASALQGVDADLATLRFRIGKAYEAQYVNVLLGDLRRHVDQVNSSEILLRWSNAASRAKGGHARSPSVFPSYLTTTEELKTQLLPIMAGLERSHYVAAATAAYREAVLREVRNLIRRPLPSSNDDDNESMMSSSTAGGGRRMSSQEKSSALARNLRALDPEDAEELLMTIYVSVTETLRRLTTQTKVIMEVAISVTDPSGIDGLRSPPARSPMNSPRPDRSPNPSAAFSELHEELHRTLDVANLLGQAVDIAIEKIVKVLKVRSEQATTLPLEFFLRYFTLNLYFANECESISGRSGTSLKTVVNGHIREFVQKNRDAEMQKLAQGMESDQWAVRDFTDKNTELLNQILESTTHDNAAWTERTKLWIPSSELDGMNEDPTEPETDGTSKDKTRTAMIDSDKFVLPNSAILCLQGTATFMHLVVGIPSMTTDIASSLVAYLQLFNSRCTQLILGAGATRSAGLKNITSKHLALASQALSFISTLIPHIREFVRRHAGSGSAVSNLMGEFDRVRRLLQEHQDNIHQKLVDIMSGRAAAHAKSARALDWDSQSPSKPRAYMETLAKETSTLHRVLSKHLPDTAIQMIMVPVFASYKEHIGQALRDVSATTPSAYESMIVDVEFFITKLSKIDGFGDTGEFLRAIANTKKPKAEEPPAPAPAPTPTNTSTESPEPTEETPKETDSPTEPVEEEPKPSSEEH